jgi:hypothetical protein
VDWVWWRLGQSFLCGHTKKELESTRHWRHRATHASVACPRAQTIWEQFDPPVLGVGLISHFTCTLSCCLSCPLKRQPHMEKNKARRVVSEHGASLVSHQTLHGGWEPCCLSLAPACLTLLPQLAFAPACLTHSPCGFQAQTQNFQK